MAAEASGDSGIDTSVLSQLVVDLGPHHVAEVCRLFLADARDRVDDVRWACGSEDSDTAARSAHRLKSASGFVGATGVATLCAEVERLARGNRLDEVRALVGRLSDELERASRQLAALAGNPPGPD